MTDSTERVSDLVLVYQLVVEWAWRLDHDEARSLTDLIADEFVFTGFAEPIVGADGLRAWADAREARIGRKTHHQMTNIRIHRRAGDRITASSSLVLRTVTPEQPQPKIEFVGEYRDELLLTPGGWRFARRDLVALG